MDVQLQELIDKIKKDGVAVSESEAQNIIADAEKKAVSIVAEAEEKAKSIVKSAHAETERLEKASIDAISQASRNLLLAFKDGVIARLNAFVKTSIEKEYSSDLLKKIIPETVKLWAQAKDTDSLAVLLSETSRADLEGAFNSLFKAELAKGMEIKADSTLSGGFRIGTKDGTAYYDFSSDAIADLFCAYLNPRTAKIFEEATKSSGEGSKA